MKPHDARLTAIMTYLRDTYALRITESEGERILAAASVHEQGAIKVRGRDIAHGIPQTILVCQDEVSAALP
jgi:Actin-like ATPase involved in cell morphogenesis